MGIRIAWSRKAWNEEVRYCEANVTLEPEVFDNYVRMQANFCARDGYQDLAARLMTLTKKEKEKEQ